MRWISLLFLLSAPLLAQSPPKTMLINGQFLVRVKQAQNPAIMKEVRSAADGAMHAGPFSVMENHVVPPSGDKHDYMSLAPYWWPNPATSNGFPYVRHDGERNPRLKTIPDHENLSKLEDAMQALGFGYYLTGNEAYAQRAVLLLRHWFLDPATRMNPNLNYAQAVLGRSSGRGEGVLEARGFPIILDAVTLIGNSPSLSTQDKEELRQWFTSYIKWMQTSPNGKQESRAKNNHGSWYNEQLAGIALYLGDKDLARKAAENAEKLIANQIEPDGSQPLELARTKSFSYSEFNLDALSRLAQEAQGAGVDLWDFHAVDGASMRAALNYLLPYAEGDKKWTHKAINGLPTGDLAQPLLFASLHFHDEQYLALAKKLQGRLSIGTYLLEKEAEAAFPVK